MNDRTRSHRVSILQWPVLVSLLIGASLTLLQYGGWRATVSGSFGLPSRAWLVKEAGEKAAIYGGAFAGLTASAIALVTVLLSRLDLEFYSGAIKWMARVVLATVLVLSSILAISWAISGVGCYMR